jgi:glycosyltransferase involved in cell wall biosynthesis
MGARKKILFVITKSNFGGAQRYVYDLATRLPREQFEVAVASGPDTGGNVSRLSYALNEKQIPTIEVPSLARDVRFLDDCRAFFALAGLMRTEQPAIVHLNSSKAGGLGALAARIVGIRRIVFTIHGLPAREERSLIQTGLILAATWITGLLAHRVITVSSHDFKRVRTLPFMHRKTMCIFNGIETRPVLSVREARAALRTIDASIPDGFLIGSIGELHHNKGYELALDALVTIDAHLVIIGDGEERNALQIRAQQRGVAQRVHFVGFVPDAWKYIRAFDTFLLTSRKEGLPYVLLEAGAGHVPIIATDIAGVRDIVLPDFTGILVRRDTSEIVRAVDRIRNHTLAHSLTEAMATRVRTLFSLSVMMEKTVATYE